jgi:prolyl oligopeptidase
LICRREWRKPGFLDSNIWIGDRTGPKTRLDVPTDASAQVDRDFIAVKPRTPWTIGAETYGPDIVVGIPTQLGRPTSAVSR